MKVVSVNTAKLQSIQVGKKSVKTGIFKEPQNGAVYCGELGLEGDTIVNRKYHGGMDQAVYLYSMADYAWWADQLGRELKPGAFGENLTITDYHSAELRVGDQLRVGASVLLEITAPRVPCSQFAAKMGDSSFAKRFAAAQRPGAYARVLEVGPIHEGDDIDWRPTANDYVSINEVFVEWYRKSWSHDLAIKALNSPISENAREVVERRSGISI